MQDQIHGDTGVASGPSPGARALLLAEGSHPGWGKRLLLGKALENLRILDSFCFCLFFYSHMTKYNLGFLFKHEKIFFLAKGKLVL